MKESNTYRYDILRDCALLEKDKTFANLFEIICSRSDINAAAWLEGDSVHYLTYSEQKQLADNYAAAFTGIFGTSGRVCICLDSCKEWFPICWGILRSGHDILTVDASASDTRLAGLMKQTNCTMLVSASRRNIDCIQMTAAEMASSPIVSDYTPIWGHDIALCTSGTTSESRIFIYNEETICYLALFSRKIFKQNKRLIDNQCFNTLAFLPFHHILGFSAIFIWSHFLGDTMIYLKDRSPQTIMDTCKKCHVTQIVSVPLLANSLCRGLKSELHKQGRAKSIAVEIMEYISLAIQAVLPRTGLALAKLMFRQIQENMLGTDIKSIVLGGSRTDRRSLRHLNALGYFTICGFGMTETAINSFETSYRLSNRLRGSIGTPMLYTEFRIKNGGFRRKGELQIRGKGLHDGRFLNGELLPPDLDRDGWFTSGDIIKMERLFKRNFIIGRMKDVIVNESGENVYPDELEDMFATLQGVEQFTVLGTKKKGTRYEDITLAMFAGRNFSDPEFLKGLEDQIIRINKLLPVHKRLTRAVLSGVKLPMTNSFKVKRVDLKDMIEASAIPLNELNLSRKAAKKIVSERNSAVRDRESDEIRRKVYQIYSQILNRSETEIDPDSNFVEDMGGDSLQVLSIVSKAEEMFSIMIPAESYSSLTTVNEATSLIQKLMYGTSQGADASRQIKRVPISEFSKTEEFLHFKERIDGMTAEGAKNPYFVCHDSPLLDTSVVDGKEMLDFGSYNYVGMSGRKEVSDAAKAAIDRWGTSASGSRLLAGEKPVHSELEREIAQWKHSEAALVCVGGHSTNVTVVGNFCGKNDLILYDALAHNSVEQGCRLSEAASRPFPHNDIAALENILKAQRQFFEKVLIVIEGVYSMDGDISDVPSFVRIKKKYGCFLMVDEAHSACVLGKTGGGVDEYFSLAHDDIDIKMGTLSKGLGTCGGYLAGKSELIEYLRYNLPGFVFSVGMSPALAAGSLAAVRLLRKDPSIMEALHRNIECFATEAKKRHLDICLGGHAAVIPIMVGRDEDAFKLSTELEARGILVPPAVYPAVPRNKARLRFDVISEHKPEQIIKALDTLVEAARDLHIELPHRDY